MASIQPLSSEQNPLLKDVRRANLRGTLTENGFCLAETFHLLEEALRSQCEIGGVIASKPVAKKVEDKLRDRPDLKLYTVPDELFDHLTSTETNQGVLTLVKPPEWTEADLFTEPALVVLLDGVQDPGNVGTILRAAESFGATGALLLKGTANVYQPKAVRATAGSLFRLPLYAGLAADEALAMLTRHNVPLLAAMPRGGLSIWEQDWRSACAIVIGSEGQGVSHALEAAAHPVQIPTKGVESLNAALAAGVLLYEAHRQRVGGGR